MFIDQEGHELELVYTTNDHVLISGTSGTGKTFLDVRLMEKACREDKNVLAIDQSSSFSKSELSKQKCSILDKIIYRDPFDEALFLELSPQTPEQAGQLIAAALMEALGIGSSYNQKRILVDACTKLLTEENKICFPALISLLDLYQDKRTLNDDTRSNMKRLLNRLSTFETVRNIVVTTSDYVLLRDPSVEILQLSGFPPLQRGPLASFLLALIWNETHTQGTPSYDVIVFDEFQNFSLEESSSLYAILREGRKFGIQAILSTQYLSAFSVDAQNALQQAATTFFFRPTAKDLGKISKLIDEENTADWRKILHRLER